MGNIKCCKYWEVGRRLLAPEPCPLPPRTRPPARKPNIKLNQRPPRALFCLKLDNPCCYARYICGNNCNVVVKLVQLRVQVFLRILLPFYGNSLPGTTHFLRKWTVRSERSRQETRLAYGMVVTQPHGAHPQETHRKPQSYLITARVQKSSVYL